MAVYCGCHHLIGSFRSMQAPSPIVASPPAAGAAARRPIVSAGWGDLPPRRTLTAREMEIIELGGADP